MMTDRITATHLQRAAIVYVRQSSPEQVRNHAESTRIQIGLERRQHQRPPHPRSPAPAPRSQAVTPPARTPPAGAAGSQEKKPVVGIRVVLMLKTL